MASPYDMLRKEYEEYVDTSREIEAELEKSLLEAQKFADDMAKKKTALEERVVALQARVAANVREESARQVELDKLKERLEQAAILKAYLECGNDDLTEKVRRLESTEEDLLHKLELAEENCILLQGEVEDLKIAAMITLAPTPSDEPLSSAPIATLEHEVAEHKEMVEILETELDELKQQHRDLEKQNDDLSDELSRITDEVVTNHQGMVALQAKLEEEIKTRLSLEADKEASQNLLSSERKTAVLAVEGLRKEIMQLKIEFGGAKSSDDVIAGLQGELESSRAEIGRLGAEKEGLLKEMSRIGDEVKALAPDRQQLLLAAVESRDSLAAMHARLPDLNDTLAAKDVDLQRLQVEIQQRSSAEMRLVNKCSELNDTIAELQSQLAAARAEAANPSKATAAAASTTAVEPDDDDAREEIIRALEDKVFELSTRIEAYERNEKQSPMKLSKAAYTANMLHQEEEKKALRETIERLEREVVTYRNSLREVKRRGEKMKDDAMIISTVSFGESSIRTSVEQAIASGDCDGMRDELLRQLDRYDIVRKSNAKLLQKIQAVTGNIQVCCRTRPVSEAEAANNEKICIDLIDDCELVCFDRRSDQWRSFVFDRAFQLDASQADIFSDIEPIVLSVVDGFNTCLLAYGQTGSGKTYTMNGYSKEWGVAYRTMQKIFETLYLKKSQSEDQLARLRDRRVSNSNNTASSSPLDESILSQSEPFSFSVSVSMMEIYNDQVLDLLVDGGGLSPGLEIRQSPEGGVSVPGLRQVPVACIDDVMKVFSRGSSNRATGATNINEHSSRSHSILQVDVCTTAAGAAPLKSKLFLVDLAGSERVGKSGVTGAAMREAQHINKSLSALADVMEALDQKAKHIPYRNSKLTYLLQDALGGNSRTMMAVTICPTENFVDETLFTLQFATRIRNISLGSAKKNVNSKNLEEALKTVKGDLRDMKKRKLLSDETVNELRRENKRLGEKLASSTDLKQRSMEDARKNVEVQVQQLLKSNHDLGAKYSEEKEARVLVSQELDAARTSLRRAQEQAREVLRERDKLVLALKQKENEQAARHAYAAPQKSAHTTTSSWKSASTGLGTQPNPPSAASGGCAVAAIGGYGARSQVAMRQRSSSIPPPNIDGPSHDEASVRLGLREAVDGERQQQGSGSRASLIPVRSPSDSSSIDGHAAEVEVKTYSSRLRLSSTSVSHTPTSDTLNCSSVSLKSMRTASHRHSIDSSAMVAAAVTTATATIPAAAACGSSRAREALLRHQERMQAHREKLTSKRPAQFPV